MLDARQQSLQSFPFQTCIAMAFARDHSIQRRFWGMVLILGFPAFALDFRH